MLPATSGRPPRERAGYGPALQTCRKSRGEPGPSASYLISTLAPASSNFFLMVAASSLLTPSLTVLGAPSTRSLASFKPRLVTSRTALMTLILLPPTSVRTTVNSVFSSAGAAAAAAPPPPAATTVAAAADTPKVSSIFFTRSDASKSVRPLISSRIVSTFDMTASSPLKNNLKFFLICTGSAGENQNLYELNLLALIASLTVTARLRGKALSAVAMRCAGALSKNIILLITSSFDGRFASC